MDQRTAEVLDNIRKSKKMFESTLYDLIRQYEKKTGMTVAHVHIIRSSSCNAIIEVETEVVLS